MELNRLLRMFATRWRVLALIAVIGFLSAFGFTSLSNQTVEERYEVVIPLRFDLEEGETVEDLSIRISDAQGLAQLAAQGLLEEYDGATIQADTTSGRLFFRAEGSSREVAQERARNLLLAYLGSDQVGGDLGTDLDSLAEEAEAISGEIDALQLNLTLEEQALLRQHDILDRSITAAIDSLVALNVAPGVTAEESAINAERRDDLNQTIANLTEAKAALPPAPATELSVSEQLRLSGLERQLEVIRLEYERLTLLEAGVLTDNSQQEAPRVNNLAPTPTSPLTSGLMGLVAGGGLAMFALVFVSRSRREVWLAEDLPVPLIAEVPNRKVTSLPGPSWYDSTDTGQRKESIQAARTVIEGALGHEAAAFALVSSQVSAEETHALAADLAASFASAGRSVLLIDADFHTSVEMTEYSVGEPSLGSILAMSPGSSESMARKISRALEDAIRIRPDLSVMPSGSDPSSVADALASQPFRQFLAMGRAHYDLIIAVGGPADAASSQVLCQRLGAAIVAVAPGKTTVPRLEGTLIDMSQQRVLLPGVIMVHGNESKLSLSTAGASPGRRRPQVDGPPPDLSSRLRHYPFPGSKRSLAPTDGSLNRLVTGLEESRAEEAEAYSEYREPDTSYVQRVNSGRSNADTETAGKVVDAISSMSLERAYGPVADYVVARVEDMMTAIPGQANVSQEMVDVVNDLGFVPLTPVSSIPTVWERLVAELKYEAGDALGERLEGVLSRVLTGSSEPGTRGADEWLSREFFKRHLERTDREPDVWHLSSPSGAIQLLVSGRRLTDERLGRLTSDLVRRRIHELERDLKDARQAGDDGVAARIESQLKDAHLLEVSLGVLRGGSSEEARLVYPWRKQGRMPQGWHPIWSEGIRPNIAPLQRLELLPEPVLTDEELLELVSAG